MSIQGVGPRLGLKGLGKILRTEEGRNAIAAHLGERYAQGKGPGARVLGQVLARLPESQEPGFIGQIQRAKSAAEERLY